MCERCTIIESAFGLKDPLPPRVASLDVQTPIPDSKDPDLKDPDLEDPDLKDLDLKDLDLKDIDLKDGHTQSLPAKHDTDLSLSVEDEFIRVPQTVHDAAFDQLWLSDGVKPVWQPPAFTLSGIRDSPLTPHR